MFNLFVFLFMCLINEYLLDLQRTSRPPRGTGRVSPGLNLSRADNGYVITIGMDLYRSTLSMTQGRTARIVSALMTNKVYLGPILIKQLSLRF